MKENKMLLSEFANEDGFELNKYITHLFEYVANQVETSNKLLSPIADKSLEK